MKIIGTDLISQLHLPRASKLQLENKDLSIIPLSGSFINRDEHRLMHV